MLPEEITRPPAEEFSTDGAEISPPSDEFFHRAVPAEPPKKKRKPIQLAAGVIAAVVVVGAFVNQPRAWDETPTEPSSPVAETTDPIVETTAPSAVPPAPFEPETLESYQNTGDTCIITVYADYFDPAILGNAILMEQTVQESTFTELTLPDPPVYEGCSVLGYVIEYSAVSADFHSTGFNPGSKAFAVDVGFSLTLDELQLVPVWEEDQIRHVFVHPIWATNDGYTNWKYAPVVTLDSGDERVAFPFDLPLGSGACFYPCAMVPEKEGYTFAGWYNDQDQRVYFIHAVDLFTQWKENTNEIDWTKPTNVTLTAKWIQADS